MSIRTHRLLFRDEETAVFKVSFQGLAYDLMFIVLGLTPALLAYGAFRDSDFVVDRTVVGLLGLTVAMTAPALWFLRLSTRPVVFDRRRGYYWKGRTDPDETDDRRSLRNFAKFEEIVGLQIIPKNLRQGRSYELNLILRDSSRMNVVNHGNGKRVREDAEKLAQFLEVELLEIGR